MSTSTHSDPLPSPALPSSSAHPTPAQLSPAAALPSVQAGAGGEGKAEESLIDLKGFAAGTASGITKLIVGQPFDMVKVRVQCSPPGLYSGPLDALRKTVGGEGLRALYKGATPPAIGWTLSDSMLMGSLHQYRVWIAAWESGTLRSGWRDDGSGKAKDGAKDALGLSLGGHFLAGLLAGQTVCFVAAPTEHLKARLQMQTTGPKLYSGPIDCAKKIVQVKGFFGLWHGLGATLLFRSWMGVMFLSYEIHRRLLDKYYPDLAPGTAAFISAGAASNYFWTCAFPADAVKNRLMSDSLTNPKYPTWMSAARSIYREGGARAFYRGFTPAILRAFPTNASAMIVWEAVMNKLGSTRIQAKQD
ncbi:hypothetical protein JCM8547_007174 [Rhodosporidiobolus lusitaniae]